MWQNVRELRSAYFMQCFSTFLQKAMPQKKNRDAANTSDIDVCTSNLTISLAEAIAEPLPEHMRAGC